MRFVKGFIIASGALAVVLAAGCTSIPFGEDDFYVKEGVLMRDDDAWTIRAVHNPDAGAEGGAKGAMLPAMGQVAKVGGNTIAFDLQGFNDDGTELDPMGAQAVEAIAERAETQHMAGVVRVLGDATDPAFRENAAKTAAETLKAERRAIYWIDGPDTPSLVARFKETAPTLVVATAPGKGGDVEYVDFVPYNKPEALEPEADEEKANPDDVHFILPAAAESYTKLDKALMTEEEKEPWEPDNSVLSEEEREAGFIALFNGKNLDGWWFEGDNTDGFHVSEYGFIEWVEDGADSIKTVNRYGNFILRLEYKILEGGNSGLFLRAPRACRESYIGMEFQLKGDHGKEPCDTCTGALYSQLAPQAIANKPGGEWNAVEIKLEGNHLHSKLNGTVIHDYDLSQHDDLAHRNKEGFIGLQDHGDYVAFRNIRIKPL